jgi:hypothetical protein
MISLYVYLVMSLVLKGLNIGFYFGMSSYDQGVFETKIMPQERRKDFLELAATVFGLLE